MPKIDHVYLVKFKYLLVSTLVVTTLFLAGLFFNEYFYNQKNVELIEYAPLKSVVYVELNLANESLQNYFEDNLSAKRAMQKYILDEKFKKEIFTDEVALKSMAYLVLKDDRDEPNLSKMWLFKGDNIDMIKAMDLEGYYIRELSPNVLAVSLNRDYLSQLKRQPVSNQKKVMDDNQVGRVFFTLDELRNFINKVGNMYLPKSLVAKGQNRIWGDIFIKQDELNLRMQVEAGNFLKSLSQNTIEATLNNKTFVFLPLQDVVQIRSVDLISLGQVLSQTYKSLENFNNLAWINFIEMKYKFNFNNLYTFFKQPIFIVMRPGFNDRDMSKMFNFKKIEFVLAWQKEKVIDKKTRMNFENLIGSYLAFNNPVIKEKILPDKTVGLERVADVDNYVWQVVNQPHDKVIYRKLSHPQGEVVYFSDEDMFLVGNSRDLLDRVRRAGLNNNLDNNYPAESSMIKIGNQVFKNAHYGWHKTMYITSKLSSEGYILNFILK